MSTPDLFFPEYSPTPFIPPPDSTTLAAGDFTDSQIINRLYLVLIGIIQILQKVAAAQSERLNFLSEWQRAYTDLIDQVPTFVRGGTYFGGTTEEETLDRDDANRINTTFIEEVRNRRSILQDDAKALQANINQSTDAVDNQSSMATLLMQQMQGMLATIYR